MISWPSTRVGDETRVGARLHRDVVPARRDVGTKVFRKSLPTIGPLNMKSPSILAATVNVAVRPDSVSQDVDLVADSSSVLVGRPALLQEEVRQDRERRVVHDGLPRGAVGLELRQPMAERRRAAGKQRIVESTHSQRCGSSAFVDLPLGERASRSVASATTSGCASSAADGTGFE